MKIGRLTFPANVQGLPVTLEDIDLTSEELETIRKLIEDLVMPKPMPMPTVRAVPYGTIDCEYKDKCVDKYEKCGSCANNKAASYYKPREQ